MQDTDTPDDYLPWLRLALTPGVGLLSAHRLLERYGTPHAMYAAPEEELASLLKPAQVSALLGVPPGLPPMQQQIEHWLRHPGRCVLGYSHPDYPDTLRQLPMAPLLLYAQGRTELLAAPSLAVVGSRNASAQGAAMAERMALALSRAGLTIVSGLAMGIDAAAHRGGLAGPGATVAVVGTGVDRIYPARNAALARRIADEGCIISEYPLGTPPRADNFPRRNRLISGLARGVLVVEAALASGSLITAKLAASQGREVYAVPGSVHSALSKGCHQLLREGARLVETAADILGDWPPAAAPEPDDRFVDRVLQALGGQAASADVLAVQLGQDVAELQGQLLALELAGLVERLPGGLFQRLG
ncbi:DNA-processing protein DprA [Oxalobacteraceae bacterium A2-2]